MGKLKNFKFSTKILFDVKINVVTSNKSNAIFFNMDKTINLESVCALISYTAVKQSLNRLFQLKRK